MDWLREAAADHAYCDDQIKLPVFPEKECAMGFSFLFGCYLEGCRTHLGEGFCAKSEKSLVFVNIPSSLLTQQVAEGKMCLSVKSCLESCLSIECYLTSHIRC